MILKKNLSKDNKGIKLIVPTNGTIYRFVIEETSNTGNLTDEFC